MVVRAKCHHIAGFSFRVNAAVGLPGDAVAKQNRGRPGRWRGKMEARKTKDENWAYFAEDSRGVEKKGRETPKILKSMARKWLKCCKILRLSATAIVADTGTLGKGRAGLWVGRAARARVC
jgi:hypothetical protein